MLGGMDVLICGAGVAGTALAFWLARAGFRPTVVERSAGLRSSGNPVDVRGPALPVAEAMGLLPELRAVATRATRLRLLTPDGRSLTTLRVPGGGIEVTRADLVAVLHRAAAADAGFRFDDTVTALRPDGDGVEVTFDRAEPARFDLVIGADGLHSAVRRLTFGPESGFVRPAGLAVATTPLPGPPAEPDTVQLLNTPGRLVALHPGRDAPGVAFIFRTGARVPDRRTVADAYRGLGWRVPELLAAFAAAPDPYLDAVSVVRLPRWSRGRVGLLGDAASCVSLFGDGSSLALAGARTLAAALAADPGHPEYAFAAYERTHRALVTPKVRGLRAAAGMLVPRTAAGLAARNLAARAAR
jgi:2-polyprenyl-6-methoxyphenol hydroxylase-like FAD-dependent oxidoreductase